MCDGTHGVTFSGAELDEILSLCEAWDSEAGVRVRYDKGTEAP